MVVPSVSVSILVRNGEKDLKELASFLEQFGEVVIADDASSDNTQVVAEQFGWKHISVSSYNNFAEKRTAAISATSGDWVLILDCDERPLPNFEREVESLVSQRQFDAFEMKFRTQFGGQWLRYGGLYPLWVTRLFRRDRFVGFVGEIHERLVIDGKTARSNLEVDHRSYSSVRHYIEKINNYTDQEALELAKTAQVTTLPPIVAIMKAGVQAGREARQGGLTAASIRNAIKNNFKNKFTVRVLLPLYPSSRFVYLYVIRGGYRDGGAGLRYAALSASYSIVKYAKFFEGRDA